MRIINSNEMSAVTVELNGEKVTALASPRMLLSDFLRHSAGSTGTHVGCEHGVCGCCTVKVDGVASRSCLMLAMQADGRRIETVEGLATDADNMAPLQRAFRRHHALQCGFCTPGILMSFSDFLGRNPNPGEDEVREVLGGHICRCTGYEGLMRAIMEAASEMRGEPVPAASDTV
ncbi:(2Fe-2S)-binding protein [Aquamicrobium defluvii]|uniref:2-furoyl-CoA dehydrogenase 2Fe-2S iron sulfur subunit n=1 Tax=Aquamicrobium defluvii TaxID=69279 RepID=A0A4R6YDX0_9HYPH|nr:2-furoyl-CoA dehydrogenase 2Fe-2S iron sulfur subunit [Aquamicrobium defluvii]